MDATVIMPILKKKLTFLSGGKDRRSGLILTIPLCLEHTNMDELSVTLDYLLSIPSDKCKARGFTVIVDGRKSQWNIVKTVVLIKIMMAHQRFKPSQTWGILSPVCRSLSSKAPHVSCFWNTHTHSFH
uniref:Uncharacterized protein n=1 Tax=Leptobrachium leishanense TaxID=445787 RepID=A0A8C5LPA3_9ANUR